MSDGVAGPAGTESGGRARPTPDRERVVVVTGGTGGLGRWIVRRFAANGNRLHLAVREPATRLAHGSLAELEGILADEERERITYQACDVAVPDEVEDLVETVLEEEGRLDVLVHAVGGFAMASLEDTEPADWHRMMELNATSAFLCSRAAARPMRESGWGRIVTVASMPALERGSPGMAAYGAAKTALVHLTLSLARELGTHGITANALVPTVIDTPANRAAMPDAPGEDWVDPRDIAGVVAFLASDAAAVVNGAAIPLSRG